jgi:hypothetical protein
MAFRDGACEVKTVRRAVYYCTCESITHHAYIYERLSCVERLDEATSLKNLLRHLTTILYCCLGLFNDNLVLQTRQD